MPTNPTEPDPAAALQAATLRAAAGGGTVARSRSLPMAQELQAYESVLPGSAERLLKMAEEQSAHRMKMELQTLTGEQARATLGQYLGLVTGLVGLSLGTFLACSGHDAVGGVFGGTTVVSLVSVFVIGQVRQARSSSGKKPR